MKIVGSWEYAGKTGEWYTTCKLQVTMYTCGQSAGNKII